MVENGKTQGVIGIDIDLKELSKIISGIEVFNSGFGVLVSNEGLISAYKDLHLLEKKFIDNFDFNDYTTKIFKIIKCRIRLN